MFDNGDVEWSEDDCKNHCAFIGAGYYNWMFQSVPVTGCRCYSEAQGEAITFGGSGWTVCKIRNELPAVSGVRWDDVGYSQFPAAYADCEALIDCVAVAYSNGEYFTQKAFGYNSLG
eukprot:Awhi_evm1s11103